MHKEPKGDSSINNVQGRYDRSDHQIQRRPECIIVHSGRFQVKHFSRMEKKSEFVTNSGHFVAKGLSEKQGTMICQEAGQIQGVKAQPSHLTE